METLDAKEYARALVRMILDSGGETVLDVPQRLLLARYAEALATPTPEDVARDVGRLDVLIQRLAKDAPCSFCQRPDLTEHEEDAAALDRLRGGAARAHALEDELANLKACEQGAEDVARDAALVREALVLLPRSEVRSPAEEAARRLHAGAARAKVLAEHVGELETDAARLSAEFAQDLWVQRSRLTHAESDLAAARQEVELSQAAQRDIVADNHRLRARVAALERRPWVQCTTVSNECLGGCRSMQEHDRYRNRELASECDNLRPLVVLHEDMVRLKREETARAEAAEARESETRRGLEACKAELLRHKKEEQEAGARRWEDLMTKIASQPAPAPLVEAVDDLLRVAKNHRQGDCACPNAERCVESLVNEVEATRAALAAHDAAKGGETPTPTVAQVHRDRQTLEQWNRQCWDPKTERHEALSRLTAAALAHATTRATPEPAITHAAPVPMLLVCPHCGTSHHDTGEWATRPHRTHLCLNAACGKTWRPRDFPTVGVAAITHAALAAVVEEVAGEVNHGAEPEGSAMAEAHDHGWTKGAREVLRRATGGQVPEVVLKSRVAGVLNTMRRTAEARVVPGREGSARALGGLMAATDHIARDLNLTLDTPPSGPGGGEREETPSGRECDRCGSPTVYERDEEPGALTGDEVCPKCEEREPVTFASWPPLNPGQSTATNHGGEEGQPREAPVESTPQVPRLGVNDLRAHLVPPEESTRMWRKVEALVTEAAAPEAGVAVGHLPDDEAPMTDAEARETLASAGITPERSAAGLARGMAMVREAREKAEAERYGRMSVEEATAELEAQGVDVPAFITRTREKVEMLKAAQSVAAAPEAVWERDGIRWFADGAAETATGENGAWEPAEEGTPIGVEEVAPLARALAEAKRALSDERQAHADDADRLNHVREKLNAARREARTAAEGMREKVRGFILQAANAGKLHPAVAESLAEEIASLPTEGE